MDNVINPTLQVLPSVSISDKVVMVDIVRLPSNIKVGDIILLETLMNSGTSHLGNSEPTVRLNILTENQKIPLEIKGDLPLKFDTSASRQYVAKVISENTLQLVANRKETIAQTFPDRRDILVKETNTSLPQVKLAPVSGQQIIMHVMKDINLPQPVQNQITNLLPPSIVSVKIEHPITTNIKETSILQPLKTAIQNMGVALVSGSQTRIESGSQEIMRALQNLVTQKFVAVPQANVGSQSGAIKQLVSPLGKIQVETTLHIPPQTDLELAVTDIKIEPSKPLSQDLLQKIFSFPEIENIFPEADGKHLSVLIQNRDTAVENLFKIFEPLHEMPQMILPILKKIPSFNRSILSDLYSFYKGAVEQDAKIWLGAETTTQLQSIGVKGQVALQNMQDFVASLVRDTPTWRIVEIPLFNGSQLIPFKLSVQKDQSEEKQTRKPRSKNGTRFVIDTDFSKLGAFQIDGFSVAKERRLDLIIRTSRAQKEDFCSHIINLFKTSLYSVGYIGTIAINQKQAFVKTEIDNPTNLSDGVYI